MTQSQNQADRCGLIPEENPPEFFAKHLSAYRFVKTAVLGKKVLEVGFGDGYGMHYLSGAASEVVGLDIAPKNIPLAREKYKDVNLAFHHFDGTTFPFESGTFDIVCSFQVIEHVPEARLPEWLGEIKRVMKKDGRFFVSTLNLTTAMKPDGDYIKHHDHEKEYTADELEALLTKAFGRVEMHGLYYSAKHLFYRRLKKWGLAGWEPVKRHFEKVTTEDFVVHKGRLKRSIDLFAVCH